MKYFQKNKDTLFFGGEFLVILFLSFFFKAILVIVHTNNSCHRLRLYYILFLAQTGKRTRTAGKLRFIKTHIL